MSKQPPQTTKTKVRQPEPAPARKARAATVEPSSQADAFVNYQHTGIATPENKALFRDQDYVRSLRSNGGATPEHILNTVTTPAAPAKTKPAVTNTEPAPATTNEGAPADTPAQAPAASTAATAAPATVAPAVRPTQEQAPNTPAPVQLGTNGAPAPETAPPTTAGPEASVAEAPAPEAATESAPEIEAVPVEQAPATAETPAPETAAAPDIAAPAAVEGGTGPAAAWLLQASAAAMARATAGIGQLSTNQNTVTPAATLRQQSEAAVTPPAAEEQAAANQGQVEAVSTVEVPEQDEAAAQATLHQQLLGAMPADLEALDEFEEDNELGNVNDHVQRVVSSGTAQVQQGFGGMGQTPAPVPGTPGQPMPAPMAAPATAGLALGDGMVQELPEEMIDTSAYVAESDALLEREGITQEQLDMVDSGDLAEANTQRAALNEEANGQPAAIRDLRRTEAQNMETELAAEENESRAAMERERNATLQQTGGEQERAKTELELRREAVSATINQKFEDCQTRITQRLEQLNIDAMAQFEAGQERATRKFERQVNRDIDAFKARRYDVTGGSLLWLKDKLFGIDEFPEVKKAFDDARAVFVADIDLLIANITSYTNQVIEECKQDVEDTRAEIAEYVANLAPELQEVGNNSMAEMQQKLDDLNTRIEEEAEALNQRLEEKRQQAIEAIDKKIEEMKASMSGLVNILGNLLLDAAKKFFTWVLEAAGLNPDEIMGFLNKGAETFMFILRQPIAFVKNLIDAAILGFNNFGGNFLKHLQDALFGWLTGSLGGIQLPSEWNLEGIMSVILQVVGIGWDAIRGKLVKLMGEPAVVVLETGFTLVQTLITDGPMAAWEQLKDMAGDMKDAFIDAIQSWIQEKIVLEAIKTIVSIFIPGAGIVKAIIAIYDTIMFFVEKAKDIIQMVGNFINSAADIAAGNIGGAADKLEGGLATALQLVINFLAKFLHLDGISEKIKKVIQKIRDKVDKALDKVVEWIKKKAKDLFGKKEDEPAAYDPEKQAKVDAGLIDLQAEQQKYLVNGEITREDADKVAHTIKSRHQVFSAFRVVDGDDSWDYAYAASPERILEGPRQHGSAELIVGPHPLHGQDRESHHVPANQLSKAYADFYESAANAIAPHENVTINELKSNLLARSVFIRSNFDDAGNRLSAILVHRDTHRTGSSAVHGSAIQNDVLNDINNNLAQGEVRVVVEIGNGSRLVANLSDAHWQAFLRRTYEITTQENVDVTQNGRVVSVKLKEARNGTEEISNNIGNQLSTSLEQIDQTDDDEVFVVVNGIKTTINTTITDSFSSALENGISAIRVAMSNSQVDGTQQDQEAALSDLRIVAREIWRPIIQRI